MEVKGHLMLEECIKMAWIMDYIKHFDGHLKEGTLHMGWVDAKCNWPRASGLSHDPGTLVSVGTGQNGMHSFVLPLSLHCMISIGAASCLLSCSSLSGYHCPVSCSLYCIGMTCGGPCSSPDY